MFAMSIGGFLTKGLQKVSKVAKMAKKPVF